MIIFQGLDEYLQASPVIFSILVRSSSIYGHVLVNNPRHCLWRCPGRATRVVPVLTKKKRQRKNLSRDKEHKTATRCRPEDDDLAGRKINGKIANCRLPGAKLKSREKCRTVERLVGLWKWQMVLNNGSVGQWKLNYRTGMKRLRNRVRKSTRPHDVAWPCSEKEMVRGLGIFRDVQWSFLEQEAPNDSHEMRSWSSIFWSDRQFAKQQAYCWFWCPFVQS